MGKYGSDIEEHRDIIFIAGGIGIIPFISLLMRLDDIKAKAKITLFWANNKMEDFFALDFFKDLSERLNIKIVLVSLEPVNETSSDGSKLLWKSGFLTAEIFKCSALADPCTYKKLRR